MVINMLYIYETHLHTCLASACGKSHGYEYISFYKNLGYSGIFVTEHFFNGNTCVPDSLSWEERVNLFCKGYEEAKEEGDRQGISVFFAWECRFDGDEYLVYGLDKKWLLDHPDILSWDHITHYKKVKESGGLVVQAHPFRERGYLSRVDLHPYQCDAWEVANAGNPSYQDRLAFRYATTHSIPMTAGSDIHLVNRTESGGFYGVAFDSPLTSAKDYADRIKSGKGYSLHVPADLLTLTPDSPNTLPVYLFDKKNQEHYVPDVEKIL